MSEEWKEGLDESAIERSVEQGEILPKCELPSIEPGKKSSEQTLYVKFLTNPKKVISEHIPQGQMFTSEVHHQGARKSLVVPKSLRFNLAKECKIHKLDGPAGKYFVIGANLGDLKATKDRPALKDKKMYWTQLVEKGESVKEEAPVETNKPKAEGEDEFA